MTLKQGLPLDELDEMKTRLEREAKGESGGEQSPPTAGTAEGNAVPHHRRNSPMVKAWLHAERVISLRGIESIAAAKARRWTSHMKGVSWVATATHHCSKGDMPLEQGG